MSKRWTKPCWVGAFLLLVAAGVAASIAAWQPPHSDLRDQWSTQAIILGVAGAVLGFTAAIIGDMGSDD